MNKLLFFVHYNVGGKNMKYEYVPNIISSKDLDYLSDMFNWNFGAYKTSFNAVNSVSNEELKNILNKSSDTFMSIMNNIINIMGGNHE